MSDQFGELSEPLIQHHEATRPVNTAQKPLPCQVPIVYQLPPYYSEIADQPDPDENPVKIYFTRPYLIGKGQLLAVYHDGHDFCSMYCLIVDLPDPTQQDGGLPETEGYGRMHWKKVDFNFPKIDPRTGMPYDPTLAQYSSLAR